MEFWYFFGFSLIFLALKFASRSIKGKGVSSALNFFATPLIVISIISAAWFGVYLGPTVPLALVMFALILSVVGDVYNSMPNNSHFMWGLVYFAMAHVLYIIAFMSITGFSWALLPIAIGFMIILSLTYLKWKKRLDVMMSIAVPFYMGMVSVMLLTAIGAYIGHHSTGTIMLMCGALSFFISDFAIGINAFWLEKPSKTIGALIWITYAIAQALFASCVATGLFSLK